ncbi:MAG: hypothetical protein M3Y65_18930 [Pseudomonadota bacterium]|nr:hypothetical protein [Pseudomonadota bacterium]
MKTDEQLQLDVTRELAWVPLRSTCRSACPDTGSAATSNWRSTRRWNAPGVATVIDRLTMLA